MSHVGAQTSLYTHCTHNRIILRGKGSIDENSPFFKVIRLHWEGIEFLVEIINPRRMRGGYGSHRVCVCVYLSVSALTAIYLVHKCRVRCYKVPYGV